MRTIKVGLFVLCLSPMKWQNGEARTFKNEHTVNSAAQHPQPVKVTAESRNETWRASPQHLLQDASPNPKRYKA